MSAMDCRRANFIIGLEVRGYGTTGCWRWLRFLFCVAFNLYRDGVGRVGRETKTCFQGKTTAPSCQSIMQEGAVSSELLCQCYFTITFCVYVFPSAAVMRTM